MKTTLIVALLVACFVALCSAVDPIDQQTSYLPIGNTTVTTFWRKIYTRAIPAVAPRLVRVLGVAYAAAVNETTLSGIANWNAFNIIVSNFQQVGIYFGFFTATASGSINTDSTSPTANIDYTAAQTVVAVRYLQLVEYTEANSQNGYQRGADSVVSTYDLTDTPVARWKNLANSTTEVVNTALNTTKTLWAVPIESFDGVFRARITGAGGPLALGKTINTATRIDSASLKVDLQMKYYNSANATSGNTSVAICFAFAAKQASGSVSFNASASDPNNPTLSAQHFDGSGMTLSHGFAGNASITTAAGATESAVVYFDSWIDADSSVAALFPAGWTVKVGCASWTSARPSIVFWDPIITMTNTPNPDPNDTPAPTNAAHQATAGLLLVSVLLLLLALAF